MNTYECPWYRAFMADVGKHVINCQITLDQVYLPAQFFDLVLAGAWHDKQATQVKWGETFSFLGIHIFKSHGDDVIAVAKNGVVVLSVDIAPPEDYMSIVSKRRMPRLDIKLYRAYEPLTSRGIPKLRP